MYTLKPIWRGKNAKDQLKLIIHTTGKPDPTALWFVEKKSLKDVLLGMKEHQAQDWAEIVPDAPTEALELIDHLLTFDPEKRFTVTEAIDHPFIDPVSPSLGFQGFES